MYTLPLKADPIAPLPNIPQRNQEFGWPIAILSFITQIRHNPIFQAEMPSQLA